MSNKTQSPFEEFNWSEIQKKYMDALMAFNTPNPFNQPTKPGMESFWVHAMSDWWKNARPETTHENATLFEKVIEQCRIYYFMSEQFSSMVDSVAKSTNKNDDITSLINNKFKEIGTAFLTGNNNFNWANIMDTNEQPVDFMKNAFSNMSSNSGDLFDEINLDVKKIREQFLSIPGFGYSRETQDKYQEVIKLWADYQDNNQEYQSVMARLNFEALELMRNRIIGMTKNDEKINSMRQIYDLWVESNEKVYGDYVFTEEYSELNGRLVNSLMAFKKKSHEITEDVLTVMNMPTTKAVTDLERRQYELRKQMKVMQAEVKHLKTQLHEKNSKPVAKDKAVKSVKGAKKKAKKRAVADSSQVVELKQVKKKVPKNVASVKKKTKQKTKSASTNKGMIELKF